MNTHDGGGRSPHTARLTARLPRTQEMLLLLLLQLPAPGGGQWGGPHVLQLPEQPLDPCPPRPDEVQPRCAVEGVDEARVILGGPWATAQHVAAGPQPRSHLLGLAERVVLLLLRGRMLFLMERGRMRVLLLLLLRRDRLRRGSGDVCTLTHFGTGNTS